MHTRLRTPGVAWVALAAALAIGAVLAQVAAAPALLDWQPDRWLVQPWRWWTAGFVHLSTSHFTANLLAVALLAAFGMVGGVPPRTTVAWAVAWPLTHVALLCMPSLRHYGGLSGVVHAGAGAAAFYLGVSGPRRQRFVGFAALGLLLAKVLSETPWRAAVQVSPHWDIPIAPIAHLTGAVAGVTCAAAAECWHRLHRA
jgi:rhomboid family GlyGly-CTERM serine protease